MKQARASLSSWALISVVCILSGCVGVMSEPRAMEVGVQAATGGKRKVVEHAVLFQLHASTAPQAKDAIVQALADLKAVCPQWVLAESAGLVLGSSGDSRVGLFMRLWSAHDLDNYFDSPQKTAVAQQYIVPYLADEITIDYAAEVDDNDDALFRRGDAFERGAERIVGIKVKNGAAQEEIDAMINAFNALNGAPELSSLLVQITAGTNFCARDQRYTHGVVVRCPSLEALQEFSDHPLHVAVMSKTVWPIAEKLLTADYIVNAAGDRKGSL